MASPSISVLTPTLGRPSLVRAAQSLSAAGMREGDEWVVLVDHRKADAFSALAVRLPVPPGITWTVYVVPRESGRGGGLARDYGMRLAKGDRLAFLDDDDVFRPGALTAMRERAEAEPEGLHVFRMATKSGAVLWRAPVVAVGNVGTPMFCVPNDPAVLGEWGEAYECDHAFLASTVAKAGEERLRWVETVVCDISPSDQPLRHRGGGIVQWFWTDEKGRFVSDRRQPPGGTAGKTRKYGDMDAYIRDHGRADDPPTAKGAAKTEESSKTDEKPPEQQEPAAKTEEPQKTDDDDASGKREPSKAQTSAAPRGPLR